MQVLLMATSGLLMATRWFRRRNAQLRAELVAEVIAPRPSDPKADGANSHSEVIHG